MFYSKGNQRQSAPVRVARSTSIIIACVTALLCVGSANAAPPELPEQASLVAKTVIGKLTVLYEDDFRNNRSELKHFITDTQTNQRFRIEFPEGHPRKFQSGSIVKLRGRMKNDTTILAANGEEQGGIEILSAQTAATIGEKKVIVMVGNFSDADAACSVADVRDAMFTDPNDQSVDDLYRESSFGNTWFNGQVVGPYALNHNSNSCETEAWANSADASAIADGVDLGAFDHKVYVLPAGTCPVAGSGTVGGSPSRSWIFVCSYSDVFAHELGHNFGMTHASTPTASYGDSTDFMGIAQNKLRHPNAPHKQQLGWLSSSQTQTITASGVYEIAPLELPVAQIAAPQVLKLAKPDTNETYYLSYRRGIGFDTSLSPFSQLDRLSIHRHSGVAMGGNTYLLGLLADTESYTDSVNGITVTQLSHNDSTLTVDVQMDGSTPVCTSNNPALSITPQRQTATISETRYYSVNVTNRDSGACAASNLQLAATVPGGWSGSVAPSTLSLAAGESGQATLQATSPAQASGSNQLTVNAFQGAQSASANAWYDIAETCTTTAPSVSLTPSRLSGAAGDTLSYVMEITNNDGPACASSNFEVQPAAPGGWIATAASGSQTLAPQSRTNVTVTVTSPSGATSGEQSITARATHSADTSLSGSGTAVYAVQSDTTADETAPTTPSLMEASVKRKHIGLSWGAATDDVGVAGYRVWRDGVVIATTSDTSFTDRNVQATASYVYHTTALDAAGNESALSNPAATSSSSGGNQKGKPRNR